MKYYDNKFLNYLKLDSTNKYSKQYIFTELIKKCDRINICKQKSVRYILNEELIEILKSRYYNNPILKYEPLFQFNYVYILDHGVTRSTMMNMIKIFEVDVNMNTLRYDNVGKKISTISI